MEEDVYLEIKTKYKGIVGKRRVKLMLSDFYNYLESGSFKDSQIMRELDYFFKYYDLKPSIFIGYDRNSYKSYEDDDLRITIDSNILHIVLEKYLSFSNLSCTLFKNSSFTSLFIRFLCHYNSYFYKYMQSLLQHLYKSCYIRLN